MFCSVMRIFLSTLFFHFAKGQLNIRTDGSTVTLSANVVLTCQDSSSPRRSISFSFKSTTDTVFNIIGSCDLILPGCILLDATKHSIQKDVTNAAFNEYNATLKSLAVSSYGCYRCQDFSNTSVYSELCIPYKANLTEKCGSIIECYDSNAECKDTICQCKTSFEADKGICSPTTTAAPTTTPSATTQTTTTEAPMTSTNASITSATTPAASTSVPTRTSIPPTTTATTQTSTTAAPTTTEAPMTSKSSNDTNDVGAIIGGSVGGAVGLLTLIGVVLAVFQCRRRKQRKKPMDTYKSKRTSAKHHVRNEPRKKPYDRPQKSASQSNRDRRYYGQYNNLAYVGHANNRNVPSGYQRYQPNPPPYTIYDPFHGTYYERSAGQRSGHHIGTSRSAGPYTPYQPSIQRAREQTIRYQPYTSGSPAFYDYSGNW